MRLVPFGRGPWLATILVVLASMAPAVAAPDDGPPGSISTFRLWKPRTDGGGGRAPGVIAVDAKVAEPPPEDQWHDHGILIREIVRQAVLMAAREERGMRVRDGLLHDPAPDGAPDAVLELDVRFASRRSKPRAKLSRVTGDRRDVLWEHAVPQPEGEAPDFAALIRTMEAASREEIPKALDRVVESVPRREAKGPGGAAAGEAEDRLNRLEFLSEFSALRDLHAARARGDLSAKVAGAIVRAYANLGVLTEYHWSPAHKALKARALLYAERMANADGKGPWGLWHRAYARALVGRHGDALEDLDAAAKRAGAQGMPAKPDWVDLIAAFCRYDADKLAAVPEDAAQVRLARLLRFLAIDTQFSSGNSRAVGSQTLNLRAAALAYQVNPECYRVLDGTCQLAGVSLLHLSTTVGPKTLAETLPAHLQGMLGLPRAVAEAIDAGSGEPALTKALVEAGARDSGEPTWSALGWLIRETRFCLVYRRIDFLANGLSVPVDEELQASRPLIADHPYRDYFGSYTPGEPGAIQKLLAIQPRDIEMTAYPFVWSLKRFDEARMDRLYNDALSHGDTVAPDLEAACYHMHLSTTPTNARMLLAISPHSPTAMARLIDRDLGYAQARLRDWMGGTAKQHAIVFGALARQAEAARRPEEARKHLKEFIRLSPDRWAYRKLAEQCKADGDRSAWLATLEEYLTHEDHGLDHAQVREEIARDFMARREFDKAVPYADAAAQTGAGWAMLTDALCHEALGHWEEAEGLARATSQRYEGSWIVWYLWCVRTGRGDRDAAQKLAAEAIAGWEARGLTLPGTTWAFRMMSGDAKGALEAVAKLPDTQNNVFFNLAAADLADALGDVKARDRYLDRITDNPAAQGPLSIRLTKAIRPWLDDPKAGPPDLAKVDEVLTAMPTSRGNMAFFIGRFLARHGREADAPKYFAMSAKPEKTTILIIRVAAIGELRRRKIDPGDVSVEYLMP